MKTVDRLTVMLGAVLAMVFAFNPATEAAESADSTAFIIELVDTVQLCKDGEGEGRVRPVFDRERRGDRAARRFLSLATRRICAPARARRVGREYDLAPAGRGGTPGQVSEGCPP